MGSREPCGSLPVVGVTVAVYYCVHHMAWTGRVERYEQASEEHLVVTDSHSMAFGPFDSADDVRQWIARTLLLTDLPPA